MVPIDERLFPSATVRVVALAIWIAGSASLASAQTIFLQDSFTGTNGTLLSAHNPNTGNAGSWSKISGTGNLTIQTNAVENNTAKDVVLYKNTTPPTGGTAEYAIKVTATWSTAKAASLVGLIARINGAQNDRYEAVINTGSSFNNVVIRKVVSGTSTDLATGSLSVTLNVAHTIVFVVTNASKRIDVDDVTEASTTDNSITAAGVVGITMEGNAAGDTVADNYYAYTVSSTAVTLTQSSATRYDRGVLTEWRTGDEVNNLGFHVYRESNGERTRATDALIAGAGLMTGSGTVVRGERRYAFWDLDPSSTDDGAVYWLQDVDFNGTITWHGPITPVIGGPQVPGVVSSMPLRDVNRHSRRHGAKLRVGGMKLEPRWTPSRSPLSSAQMERQWAIAAQPAIIKIGVTHAGWYRVTQPELVAAGLNPQVDPRTLRLYVEGVESAIVVTGEADGRFDPVDAVEFFGTGLDTPSTDTRVYWLVSGTPGAKRIAVRDSSRNTRSTQNGARKPSFWYSVEQKERSIYFAALTNGAAENWFGQVISTEPTDIDIAVSHVDRAAPSPAQLEIVLQGVTADPASPTNHRVGVIINDNDIGEIVFDGQSSTTRRFTVRTSLLTEGTNVLRLVSRGGEEDYSLVDTVRLSYWHTYHADADVIVATADAPGPIAIGGFTNGALRLIDITDPTGAEEIRGIVSTDGIGSIGISAQLNGSGARTLFGFTDGTVASPAFVRGNRPSTWHSTASGFEYLAISHASFASSVETLADARRRQGLTAAVIDVEDIYDEFNFGEKSPQAVKDFLYLARTTGKHAPRFVVLVGDATIDPRDYSGFGDADFVPTAQVAMLQVPLETASDDWFADADEDGVPELAVGRLSVRTPEQAQQMVGKIVAYDDTRDTASWIRNVLVVADENDGTSNFEQSSRTLSSVVPSAYNVRDVFRGALGLDAARVQLLNSVNEGQLIVNYIGHASMRVWGSDASLLTADDVWQQWANDGRLPFVVAMNCLNGFFHDIYDEESLAETFLRAPHGGAVAAWASSALTLPDPQARMNQELFRLLFSRPDLTVGEAIRGAKRAVADSDVRKSWIFFGDPAFRLRGLLPVAARVADASQPTIGTGSGLDMDARASSDDATLVIDPLDDHDVHLADYNGDGRDDVSMYSAETGWQVFAARLDDGLTADLFFYRRRTGDWVTAISVDPGNHTFAYHSGRWTANLQIVIGDLNADGHDEIIAYDAATGIGVLATLDLSGGFVERRAVWPVDAQLHLGDFNGDGLRDIVGYDPRTGKGFVALNGNEGFSVTISHWGVGWTATIVDLNDDRRSDIVFYEPVTGAVRLAMNDVRGGFVFETRAWNPGLKLHAVRASAGAHEGLFGYSADTGVWLTASKTSRGWVERSGSWIARSRIAIADLDGDGIDDVVAYDPITGRGSRCDTRPHGFDCTADLWAPGRDFIGRPR